MNETYEFLMTRVDRWAEDRDQIPSHCVQMPRLWRARNGVGFFEDEDGGEFDVAYLAVGRLLGFFQSGQGNEVIGDCVRDGCFNPLHFRLAPWSDLPVFTYPGRTRAHLGKANADVVRRLSEMGVYGNELMREFGMSDTAYYNVVNGITFGPYTPFEGSRPLRRTRNVRYVGVKGNPSGRRGRPPKGKELSLEQRVDIFESPASSAVLSKVYGVSPERINQIRREMRKFFDEGGTVML